MIRPCTVSDGEYPTVTGGPFSDGVSASVTSLYGPREAFDTPAGRTGDFHYGIDLWADPPPTLVALMDGVVEYAGAWDAQVGNWIRVRSGEWSYDYYHMDSVPVHKSGDEVKAGDYIGVVGSTGLSTAPHLHLGMTLNGASVDPLAVLRERFGSIADDSSTSEEDVLELESLTDQAEAIRKVKEAAQAVGPDQGQWFRIKGGYTPKPGRVAYLVEVVED